MEGKFTVPTPDEARAALTEAQRVQEQVRRSGRWFTWFLAAVGAVSIVWITAMEAVWPQGRYALAGVWAALFLLAGEWMKRRPALPLGAGRRLTVATAAWFGLYLVAVGPVTRWQWDTSVPAWTLASAVAALPFFVAAWMGRRA
ncbi:hypothetical protein Acsp04_33410 [Actinomadura sp. NBRC 104425]|uniref:hypothetical protein n=1 Tax=Actinomadura sp. NBRC 104425 TaxID=3032204 RepID=UPI0024A26B4E|nr:hypothetical protein [Actinomadura sp. NBRC 104425]GLZ13106.1 hypothetical protein Acsp04_33410 [Actinomadura sp. NBRC 104425]